MFSYLSPDERVPAKHPLRPIRLMVDIVLQALSPRFSRLYSAYGRPSIAPEKLLRALLLQVRYHGSQRTDVDGAIGIQPAVSLVCRSEHG
jgi:transposase